MMGEMTLMAILMGAWALFMQLFPSQLRRDAIKYVNKVVSYVYPYVEITFHEYQVDTWFERSEAFEAIERYLSANSSKMAKRLKANVVKDCKSVVLSMDENEEVTDEFNGIQVWWTSNKDTPEQRALFSYRGDEENRYYRLTCRREHRDIVTKDYVKHVLDEGKAIAVRTRQRNASSIPTTRLKSGPDSRELCGATSYSSTLLPLILLQWIPKRRRIF